MLSLFAFRNLYAFIFVLALKIFCQRIENNEQKSNISACFPCSTAFYQRHTVTHYILSVAPLLKKRFACLLISRYSFFCMNHFGIFCFISYKIYFSVQKGPPYICGDPFLVFYCSSLFTCLSPENFELPHDFLHLCFSFSVSGFQFTDFVCHSGF